MTNTNELESQIKGFNFKCKTIYFRLVELSDAEFIHSLRINEKFSKYLSFVVNKFSKQEQWIKDYKKREKLGQEYYFIIHRISDSKPIGTVRVYDFLKDENSFSWGSWILNEDKTRYAALEVTILIYDFTFSVLGFDRCHMDMRKQNTKIIAFHKNFGVKIIGETDEDYLGHYFSDDYQKIRASILKVINSIQQ